MKATELMIGDWVFDNFHQAKARVNTLTRALLWGAVEEKDGFYDDKQLRYEDVKPIPLTEEILRKNGWGFNDEDAKSAPRTWSGGGLTLQSADDCGYRIVVTSDYDDEDTSNTPFILHYVHELQHALRLRRIEKEIEIVNTDYHQ